MPVAHERDPGLTLVGDLQQGAGGVLVEHSGLVDDQQITAAQDCSWVKRLGVGPGPVAVVVPAPSPLMGQPGG